MRLLPEPFETVRRDVGIGDGALVLGLLGAFLVPGCLGAAETVAFWRMGGQDFPVWRAFAFQIPQWLVYALLAPLVLWLGQRLPVRRARPVVPLLAHVAAALVLGAAYAATAAAATTAFSPVPSTRGYAQLLLAWYLSGLPVMLLTYFAILGGGWAAYWFARHRAGEVAAARLEAQLADARLSALRMQLHPHFLFNSLNAVTVLVRDRDFERAERAVHLLAGLLRESLRAGGPDRVPLSEEVDFTLRYLELERLRFPERLRVTCDVPQDLGRTLVPERVLQPLVENALRHGIAPSSSGGSLGIRARAADGRLVLTVTDDGVGMAGRSGGKTTGLGLRNVRERLHVLYGAAASLDLRAAEPGGATATVTIPLPEEEEGRLRDPRDG